MSTDVRGHEALLHHQRAAYRVQARSRGGSRAQELCESRGGRPGLPSPISLQKEEGGELDSHEEFGRFCGSRRDQEEGGGAGPQVSPEEIKSREVELG